MREVRSISAGGPGRARGRGRRGFTFVEIIIVVSILAVLLGVAIPKMSSAFRKGELKSAARDVASTLRYARHLSVVSGDGCEVRFDPDGGTFRAVAVRLGADGLPFEDIDLAEKTKKGGAVLASEATQGRRLPANVFFSLIQSGAPAGERNQPRVIFYPDGSATSAYIGLQNREENALSVQVYKTTGQTVVKAGEPILPAEAQPLFVMPGKTGYRTGR